MSKTDSQAVFLNVPFDTSYERLLVAQISVLVALGRIPHCVLEIPEEGQGRLNRILKLLQQCPVSIHDLSRVGTPARFNMPFELGIAFALSRINTRHSFIVLEKKRHRLTKTLSDLNGIDPGIHNGSPKGVIACLLSTLGRPAGMPPLNEVDFIYRRLWKAVPELRRTHNRKNIFSRMIFLDLVRAATLLARSKELIN
ncbi:MAG: hypothetical protein WCO56_27770 [Verrucomicrobiota bacterium]